jgi:hypothetical protein
LPYVAVRPAIILNWALRQLCIKLSN